MRNISDQQITVKLEIIMKSIERLQRSFVIENEQTQETKVRKFVLEVVGGVVNLTEILQEISHPSFTNYKIYDFESNQYLPLQSILINDREASHLILIPFRFFNSDIVLLKYIFQDADFDSQSLPSIHKSETSSVKKERSKERTIAQVIDLVKQWRELHLNPKNKKRLNLQQAAQVLKISKKSLDDYYYQLRLGEKYDFDFKSHMLDRIGALRTFIKERKTALKHEGKREKLEKHPKKLRIIEELSDIDLLPYRRSSVSRSSDSSLNNISMEAQEPQKEQIPREMASEDAHSVKSIEDQFYNDFQFLLEEPQDPFLNLQFNFKRKNMDDHNLFF